jgi:peptide/nickel transport system substrate-binding protein
MNPFRSAVCGVVLCLGLVACAPSAPPPPRTSDQQASGAAGRQATQPMPQRTVVIVTRGELPSLSGKPLVGFSGSLNPPVRIFNGMLDFVDEKEVAHPYLAEALPQLNTDSWRVFPDGRMETTFRLRPNLIWHDGAALTAEDFVFAHRVFSTPELGVSGSKPIRQIQEIIAPDPRTVVIRWKEAYPDAAQMDTTFHPLPKHILEGPLQTAASDAAGFANLPFWTVEYVGAGPYKVERIEPGAFLEATAFDGHALGRPRIDRLRLLPIADPSTALATMMSGDGHFIADFVIDYEQGLALEREWSGRSGGTVFHAPVLIRMVQIQFRPEFMSPRAVVDVRVRRALAHGFDVPGAIDVFTGPHGVATHTMTSPRADYYPAIERVITKRPYDPRTMQRMLEEAGLTRGSDGFYAGPGGEPFKLDLWTTGGAVFERENRIFADSLRQGGVDTTPQVMTPARLRDSEARAKTPGFFVSGAGSDRLAEYSMQAIPRPENRWNGNNRGGWENAEYDRIWQAYNATLDRNERIQQTAQMEHILNDEVGTIPLFFTVVVTANTSNLKGPVARMTPDAPLGVHHTWTWEWTR